MRRLAIGSFVLVGVGCAALIGIDETTDDPSGTDAGGGPQPDGGGDDELDGDIVVPPEGDPDATLPDEDAGMPDGSTCTLGSRTAFEVTPSGAVAEVCNPAGALAQGGDYAGLDCYGAGVHVIANKSATACVGIEYTVANLASVTIRLYSVAKGCNQQGYADGCASKMTAHVFAGTSRDIATWSYVGSSGTTRTPQLFNFPLPAGTFSVIGICRSGWGAENDDVAVDGLSATCR